MRKILYGKLYDTNHATLLYYNKIQKNDFNDWQEIYITDNGAYFVCNNSGIFTLSIEQVKSRLEEYLNDDDAFELYKKLFGTPEYA